MRNAPVGTDLTFIIPYKVDGEPVVPTGVVVTVVDQDGAVMHGPIVVSPAGAGELTFVVPAASNTLPAGETIGVRTIEVDLDFARGGATLRQSYMLRAAFQLRPLVNSFQTIERAAMTAADMVRIEAYNGADEDQRRSALLEAYVRITRLGFFVREDAEDGWRERISCGAERVSPREWPVMTEERWAELPARFHKALRRAQVQEANAILTVGTPDDLRRAGLLSKSTGESSAMFQSGKPIDLGVSRATLEQLTGYVELRMVTARG